MELPFKGRIVQRALISVKSSPWGFQFPKFSNKRKRIGPILAPRFPRILTRVFGPLLGTFSLRLGIRPASHLDLSRFYHSFRVPRLSTIGLGQKVFFNPFGGKGNLRYPREGVRELAPQNWAQTQFSPTQPISWGRIFPAKGSFWNGPFGRRRSLKGLNPSPVFSTPKEKQVLDPFGFPGFFNGGKGFWPLETGLLGEERRFYGFLLPLKRFGLKGFNHLDISTGNSGLRGHARFHKLGGLFPWVPPVGERRKLFPVELFRRFWAAGFHPGKG